ncbi:MAG TPA: DNA repair protein RecN [Bacteroidales bacterium]|nr:DNA repair protein RecN [Bacteroidales bacterium]
MLIKLYVRNYVFIRELDIGFTKGLTVITGETGAGKSILLGALSLILGARADSSALLNDSEKCIVEGTFNIEDYGLEEFFEKNDLEYDKTSIIRREINPAGKSRAFINDIPVTLNVLKELGDKLIDIHSQHENLMLNESIFQLNVIDTFAGNFLLRESYKQFYKNYRKLEREYNDLKGKAEKNRSDLEYYRFQLNQLLEAKLVENEQEELEREQAVLEHAGEIKAYLSTVVSMLSSDDASVLGIMSRLKQIMSKVKELLHGTETIAERINSAYIELDDINSETEKILSQIEDDPQKLEAINERLDFIYSLLQKHRLKSLNELINKTHELQEFVNSIVSGDDHLGELEKILESSYKELIANAEKLSDARKKTIPDIENKVTEMLRQLGMPNAKFRIILTQTEDLSETGTDRADFLFSANREVPPESLTNIASGGELSRVMLTLKSLMSSVGNLPTIIFDEIDSGVSGEVADKVGQILAGMGKYMQVINITHLPQVAARGNIHYHVYKDDSGQSTITRIKRLSDEDRILEVAKLLSGREVTPAALKNARELIEAAAGNET